MKIWITQGEHWHVPGRPITAHASLAGAEMEAVELINIMLGDVSRPPLPLSATYEQREEALELIRRDSVNGGTDCDVWITELELKP
jgi:hypothetical protein